MTISTFPQKQIIALGGGGFSVEPEDLRLEKYIIRQARKSNPKVCFIPTASGDSDSYVKRFYSSFETMECQSYHLSLFHPPTKDLQSYLNEMDVIYVGGGNTKNMLCLWEEWELDKCLTGAWKNGTLLSGLSAGAICWFTQGLTDSVPGTLSSLRCLGLLPGSCCPHFDSEVERRPTYVHLIKSTNMLPGYGIDDGVALHFVDVTLKRVVSSKQNSSARFISGEDGFQEKDMCPILLKEDGTY